MSGANLSGANLSGAVGFRFKDAPDPSELRRRVADQIEKHPELHDQTTWGDVNQCGTPCCVAGWACRLGGVTSNVEIGDTAVRLLWVDGKPMPSFSPNATRDEVLAALRA